MGLVGKFFFHVDTGCTSEVVEQVGEDTILISFDRCSRSDMPKCLTPISISSLACDIDDENARAEVFSSRAEIDAFMEWLNSPREEPTPLRVVDKTVN